MPNVLTIPTSGAIIFDNNVAGSSLISPLSTSPRLAYDFAGGINVTSYTTATTALDRFSVDGTQGRLFSVTDVLTGSLFSVNDISGLPILEVLDTDTVVAGAYNTNTLIVSGTRIAVGRAIDSTAKVAISGNITVSGTLSTNNVITALDGNSNQWNSSYTTLCSVSAFRISSTITSALFPNGYAFSSQDIGQTYHVDTRSTTVSVILPANLPNNFSVTLVTLGTNNMHVSSSQMPMLCATGTRVNIAFASTFLYKYEGLLWGLGGLI